MNHKTVAAYVLQALARAQIEGRTMNLEDLIDEIKVRRRDIRTVMTKLHQQGFVDVLRMRLTLSGFAIGASLLDQQLPALRLPKAVIAAVA